VGRGAPPHLDGLERVWQHFNDIAGLQVSGSFRWARATRGTQVAAKRVAFVTAPVSRVIVSPVRCLLAQISGTTSRSRSPRSGMTFVHRNLAPLRTVARTARPRQYLVRPTTSSRSCTRCRPGDWHPRRATTRQCPRFVTFRSSRRPRRRSSPGPARRAWRWLSAPIRSEVCATVDFSCRSSSPPGATFVLRCTQADSINIMVSRRISWYKHFKFEGCQRGVPTLCKLQKQRPRRAPQSHRAGFLV
jgi:hypothetical protein